MSWIPMAAQAAVSLYSAINQNDSNRQMTHEQMEWNANQAETNRDFNSAEAAKNRDWQAQMSNTQYQRAVNDMKSAGLNPMLAYTQGGAGTPSGSSASGQAAQSVTPIPKNNQGISDAVARAISSAQAAKGLEIQDAQIDNIHADTELKKEQGQLTNAQSTAVDQDLSSSGPAIRVKEVSQRLENLQADKLNTEQRTALTNAQTELAKIEQDLKTAQISKTEAETRTQAVLTKLKQLEIPEAQNIADYHKKYSEWEVDGKPLLETATKTLQMANSAKGRK